MTKLQRRRGDLQRMSHGVFQRLVIPLRTIAQNNGVIASVRQILRQIIHQGLGLDVNTGGMKNSLPMQHPHDDILRRYRISFELAGILGVRNIVVHPLHCMNYLNNDPKWILEQNVEYYSTLAPMAADNGLKIAIENMWQKNQYNKNITLSACSSPYELRDYVDACNQVTPQFVACLDIGHCILTGHDPVNAIEVLGERLNALHVHDVDGIHDNHTSPMSMVVNFPAMTDALKRIGYKGEYTLEVGAYFFDKFEDHALAAKQLAQVCRHLTK